MCVFKNHAFIYFLRPPSWSGTVIFTIQGAPTPQRGLVWKHPEPITPPSQRGSFEYILDMRPPPSPNGLIWKHLWTWDPPRPQKKLKFYKMGLSHNFAFRTVVQIFSIAFRPQAKLAILNKHRILDLLIPFKTYFNRSKIYLSDGSHSVFEIFHTKTDYHKKPVN